VLFLRPDRCIAGACIAQRSGAERGPDRQADPDPGRQRWPWPSAACHTARC
jgi:hypothetical protein